MRPAGRSGGSPGEAQVEDLVEHESAERGAAVHGAAEHAHAHHAHDGGDQRRVRDAVHAVLASSACNNKHSTLSKRLAAEK